MWDLSAIQYLEDPEPLGESYGRHPRTCALKCLGFHSPWCRLSTPDFLAAHATKIFFHGHHY